MQATVRVPGTCGELVQGQINGSDFLITCPTNLYSYVSIRLNKEKKVDCPPDKWKARKAFEETLKFFKQPDYGGEVQIKSEIPIGKGMASSTADIVGVCLATANALGETISNKEIAKIALSIEPTDGIMFKGITLFDHREGNLIENLGFPPKMKILVIDLGGNVDTIHFNRINFDYVKIANQQEIEKALSLVKRGIQQGDISLIGEGATISALCNQKILFKPELEQIIEISSEMGAVGVNVAHSGTVMGILYRPEFQDFEPLKYKLNEKFKKRFKFYETELISGGGEIVESARW